VALAAVKIVDSWRPYDVHCDPLSSKTSSEVLAPVDYLVKELVGGACVTVWDQGRVLTNAAREAVRQSL
jgi:hypothetical protein